MRRILNCIVVLLSLLFLGSTSSGAQTPPKKKNPQLEVQQYMEIWTTVLKNLESYYVDSVDFKGILTEGINAMLQKLDPYTTLILEEDQADFKTMTTGEYGGIGALIMQRGDTVYISEPYENQPASEAGLRAGDAIISINGESMIKKSSSDVSSKLRGQPGETLRLEILRFDEQDHRFIDITRRKIVLNAVPYYGILKDSILYINLSSFTDKAAEEVRTALLETRKKTEIKGIILDLRDNGGGLLDQAVKIVNMFVPKGNPVVETKAKIERWNSSYHTTAEPIDTLTPMAILVNRGSASSSEILSGALQDLDRAVIMGERTYGKGLVQSTRSLPHNALLKFTSAKYYIPSGRCIQAIDYSHRNEDGSVGRIPDSLTQVFHTKAGREVRDGGGIKPDIEKKPQALSNITINLIARNHIFDFATLYRSRHDSIATAAEFCITDKDYAEFCQSLIDNKFTYDRRSSKKLEELRKTAEFEGYAEVAKPLLDSLSSKLGHNLEQELQRFRPEITHAINQEIASRYYYQRGHARQFLLRDSLTSDAITLLNDKVRYDSILASPIPSDTPKKGKVKKSKK